MSKADKEKETISFLKFWLGIAVTAMLAIVGWCVANYAKIELWLLLAAGIVVLALGLATYRLTKIISSRINDLEDL